MSRSVSTLLAEARARLRAAGLDEPDADARLLVGAATGMDAAALLLHADRPVIEEAERKADAMIERRVAGEPAHRILGHRPFFLHDFRLSPATLEPRPDTEILVELCRAPVEAAITRKGACRLVDVGTGTGAIAVSLLALYPKAEAVAVDISAEALETARANAEVAGVGERFSPVLCDHLTGVHGPFDLVVSNPPYIPTAKIAGLAREVREHDPILALDGGADGLSSYRAIAGDAARVLGADGAVAVEIGQGQGPDVAAIFAQAGFRRVRAVPDLAGIERALLFSVTLSHDDRP